MPEYNIILSSFMQAAGKKQIFTSSKYVNTLDEQIINMYN